MTPRHGYEEHGDWDALATAYALSAVEPDEEARFVPHLATCVRCTETVREAIRTVGDLAYAVPDEEPPPALKQRLMTAVAMAPRRAAVPTSSARVSRAGRPRRRLAGRTPRPASRTPVGRALGRRAPVCRAP